MSSLPTRLLGGDCKISRTLYVPQIGFPGTANSTTKFYVADKLQFINAEKDIPKCAITDEGTIKEKKVEIYKTDNADTGTSKWKVGLEEVGDDDFVIRDLVNNVDRIKIDGTTGVITFNPPLSIPTTPTSGFTYQFNTRGITQYDIPAYSYGFVGRGGYYDIATGRQIYNNIFTGAPIGSVLAWNQSIAPTGSVPSGQLIINSSPVPGNIQFGFRTLDKNNKLPVVCNLRGSMFPGAPAQPIDGAIVNSVPMHNTGGTSNFTTCFNITVGVVRQTFTGAGVVRDIAYEQEFCVPFRGTGYPGDLCYFNATFNFVMETADPLGLEYEYMPFINHNATDFSTGIAGVPLRWREVVCTFFTQENL
jgi:hypothetical protein